MWIRNDLFRIRIQLSIFRVPDPGKSSGSGVENQFHIEMAQSLKILTIEQTVGKTTDCPGEGLISPSIVSYVLHF